MHAPNVGFQRSVDGFVSLIPMLRMRDMYVIGKKVLFTPIRTPCDKLTIADAKQVSFEVRNSFRVYLPHGCCVNKSWDNFSLLRKLRHVRKQIVLTRLLNTFFMTNLVIP